jgi:fatty-acyl-CoA synthase
VRVDESITVHCRPSSVWDVVGDPRQYASVMHGVTRWQPLRAAEATGVGARYAMRMRVGATDVGGEVEVVEYSPCADLAWTGVTGIDQRGRWRLREVEPGLTTLTLRIAYQSPGGLTGLIADRISARQVRDNVRRTLQTVRERCESDEQTARPTVSGGTAGFMAQQARVAAVLTGAGLIRPYRPDRMLAAALELRRWGLSLPGGYAASAALHPDALAIVDDAGELTFTDVDRRTSALASGLAAAGIGEGDRVGLLCGNHRYIVEATVALGKLGADCLYLNTGFAAPQIAGVVRSEDIGAIVHDDEFASLTSGAVPARRRFVAWTDDRSAKTSLDRLIRKGEGTEPLPPERAGHLTILTSGTTGAPRGASRSRPRTADPAVAILSRIPLRARQTTLIASPIFHAWGMANLGLGVMLSSTLVLQRRFDPEATLAAIEQHSVDVLVAVPVMLRRILELPAKTRRRYDTTSLAVVAVSGSPLPGDLANEFMNEFGDVLYNLYGSTEVATATIATPEDLRSAPGTAGRPAFGTTVRILGDGAHDVPPGTTGRIFVANEMLFEGYTSGDGRDIVNGMMATGDIGRFDDDGRLFVEGRDDEMIVSGGENVHPAEVEKVLLQHRDVVDVAVTGVEDDEWGQRLHAFVVKRPRSRLTADGVRDHVRKALARYKVPRDVTFVASLPRNPAGKVVKRELTSGSSAAGAARESSARN